MKIRLSKKMILTALEKYYKDQLDFIGEVKITPKKELRGYSCMESYECVLDMKIIGKITLLGEETTTELTISEDELKNALNYCLSNEGYTIISFDIDSGVNEKCIGYYESSTIYEPFFKGIDVTVKEKVKTIGGF